MTVAVILPKPWGEYYVAALQALLPGRSVRAWPELGPLDGIRYVVAYAPPEGLLASMPNLKVLMPIGAGVEHLLADRQLPRHVPIVRLLQPDLVQRMVEYVVMTVLEHHRQARRYREFRAERRWQQLLPPSAAERRVGILGLGHLGLASAPALRSLGFQLAGWSRSSKSVEGIQCFHGREQLPAFLARTEILVCLLPQTTETTGLIDRRVLEGLPKGASLINASRGAIVNDADLLAALESGHLEEATLDAFSVEPLPADHPFWVHPRITVTPHVASAATPDAVGRFVRSVIEKVEAGGSLGDLAVDRSRGY